LAGSEGRNEDAGVQHDFNDGHEVISAGLAAEIEPNCQYPVVLARPNADSQLALARRNAVMQRCRMSTTIPLTKRGSLTLPPALRRKLGLDKLRNPMVLVEERDGGLFLQPAVAMPVRYLPKGTIEHWIARDEAEMAAFRATPRKAKR
jgi:hypothetical protein